MSAREVAKPSATAAFDRILQGLFSYRTYKMVAINDPSLSFLYKGSLWSVTAMIITYIIMGHLFMHKEVPRLSTLASAVRCDYGARSWETLMAEEEYCDSRTNGYYNDNDWTRFSELYNVSCKPNYPIDFVSRRDYAGINFVTFSSHQGFEEICREVSSLSFECMEAVNTTISNRGFNVTQEVANMTACDPVGFPSTTRYVDVIGDSVCGYVGVDEHTAEYTADIENACVAFDISYITTFGHGDVDRIRIVDPNRESEQVFEGRAVFKLKELLEMVGVSLDDVHMEATDSGPPWPIFRMTGLMIVMHADITNFRVVDPFDFSVEATVQPVLQSRGKWVGDGGLSDFTSMHNVVMRESQFLSISIEADGLMGEFNIFALLQALVGSLVLLLFMQIVVDGIGSVLNASFEDDKFEDDAERKFMKDTERLWNATGLPFNPAQLKVAKLGMRTYEQVLLEQNAAMSRLARDLNAVKTSVGGSAQWTVADGAPHPTEAAASPFMLHAPDGKAIFLEPGVKQIVRWLPEEGSLWQEQVEVTLDATGGALLVVPPLDSDGNAMGRYATKQAAHFSRWRALGMDGETSARLVNGDCFALQFRQAQFPDIIYEFETPEQPPLDLRAALAFNPATWAS